MGKAPAFQMYAGDYFVDTITWEPEELGVYLRLLLVEWDNGPLPFDFKRLAKIAGISPKKFSNLWQILSTKFIQNGDGKIQNKRLEETRAKQMQYVELQREKGRKRAEKRWGEHIAAAKPNAQPSSQPEDSSPSPTPSPTLKIKDKEYSLAFETFYKNYPNRQAKAEAFKAWQKIKPSIELIETMLRAIGRQMENKKQLRANNQFCPEWPHPSTWLNQKRWEDEPTPVEEAGW